MGRVKRSDRVLHSHGYLPGQITPSEVGLKPVYCRMVGARLCQSLYRIEWVRFSSRSNISGKAVYLLTACQEPRVSREGLHHRLVIICLVKQHLRMTLRPTRPIGGDVGRVDVVVGVEKYHGGQKCLLESLLEGCVVERRATKAAKTHTHTHTGVDVRLRYNKVKHLL